MAEAAEDCVVPRAMVAAKLAHAAVQARTWTSAIEDQWSADAESLLASRGQCPRENVHVVLPPTLVTAMVALAPMTFGRFAYTLASDACSGGDAFALHEDWGTNTQRCAEVISAWIAWVARQGRTPDSLKLGLAGSRADTRTWMAYLCVDDGVSMAGVDEWLETEYAAAVVGGPHADVLGLGSSHTCTAVVQPGAE